MIYPEYCAGCGGDLEKGEESVCTACRFSLAKTDSHLRDNEFLSRKFWGKVPVKHTLAYLKFVKGGKTQNLLHKLKYANQPQLGVVLGRWFGSELAGSDFNKIFDLIVPIPLHISKLKKRGYNQSDKIAEGMSAGMEVNWSAEVVKRTQAATTQTKKKRYERFENVESIYGINRAELVRDKHILVVDDVMTTGATFETCVEILLRHGAREVSVAALATPY
jgi:ComF family protein